MVLVLSILGGVFSLGGNVLIARKKRSGWWIWILGNLAWLGVNFLGTMNIPMVVMYIFYLITNIAGYVLYCILHLVNGILCATFAGADDGVGLVKKEYWCQLLALDKFAITVE